MMSTIHSVNLHHSGHLLSNWFLICCKRITWTEKVGADLPVTEQDGHRFKCLASQRRWWIQILSRKNSLHKSSFYSHADLFHHSSFYFHNKIVLINFLHYDLVINRICTNTITFSSRIICLWTILSVTQMNHLWRKGSKPVACRFLDIELHVEPK